MSIHLVGLPHVTLDGIAKSIDILAASVGTMRAALATGQMEALDIVVRLHVTYSSQLSLALMALAQQANAAPASKGTRKGSHLQLVPNDGPEPPAAA